MWAAQQPSRDTGLRQGDLIAGLFLPRIALPMSHVLEEGAQAKAGTPTLVTLGTPDVFLVVTQCCSIENQKTVSLAPVRRQRMSLGQDRYLYAEADPTVSEGPVVTNMHLLDPTGPLSDEVDGFVNVADLTQIMSVGGDRSGVTEKRIAAMTPEGRRALRMRLAHFWGRVEEEDHQWFVDNGLPPGPQNAV